jgi:type II secretory pathway pseudopilin PulG
VSRRGGFTIVEMMVAVALTLLLMTLVVSVMSQVMESVSTSRATIEMNDRLRHARERLQQDLAGVTLVPNPPHRPENGEGYFEYIEGPMGPAAPVNIAPLADGIYALDTDEVATLKQPPDNAPPTDFTGATNNGGFAPDRTVGDLDDVLMFTSRAQSEPFVGRYSGTTMVESREAEIAYFVRGTTLYRRVLLIRPDLSLSAVTTNYYAQNDVSARQEGGATPQNVTATTAAAYLVPNTLGDLTKRENRFGHQPYAWPHDARVWGALGLATLQECSAPTWPFPYNNGAGGAPSGSLWGSDIAGRRYLLPSPFTSLTNNRLPLTLNGTFDAWRNPHPYDEVNRVTGILTAYQNGPRVAEDVILPNVLSFDVKVWDPGAPLVMDTNGAVHQPGDPAYLRVINSGPTVVGFGAFVDLNYLKSYDTVNAIGNPPADGFVQSGELPFAVPSGTPPIQFGSFGDTRSGVAGAGATATPPYLPAVYDTWSTHYESDGIDQNGDNNVDSVSNGIDDDNQNGVDDPGEMEAPPPYPYPLRAVQIKIRVFEPDSRQIREVTVVHEFSPQ